MNRKQVLKNMKKNKKEKRVVEEDNYVNRFITYLFILLLLLVATYLFIGIFVTKTIFHKEEETKEETEVTIDNDTILLGEVFDQKDSEYYVLVYDVSDEKEILGKWKSIYQGKENALKVYVVDSSKKLNGNFLTEKDSNPNATGYSDLKVKSPTLIKISNGSISEYTEGQEEIKNIFKN